VASAEPVPGPRGAEAIETLVAAAVDDLRSWAAEGDTAALRLHRWALEAALALDPGAARHVQAMAVGGVALLRNVEPEDALLLGETAQRARLLIGAPTPSQAFAGTLLHALVTEATIVRGRLIDADARLGLLLRSSAQSPVPRPVERFLQAAAATLRGRVEEDSLEFQGARLAYREALDAGAYLIDRATDRRHVAAFCAEALGDAPEGGAATADWFERDLVAPVVVWALLGWLRIAASADAPADEVRQRWTEAERLIARYGLPACVGTLRLAATVRAVAPSIGFNEALEFAADDPACVAAVAEAMAACGDRRSAARLFTAAGDLAANVGDAAAAVGVLAARVASRLDEPPALDELADALLDRLGELPGTPSLAEKAAFVPSLGVALQRVLIRWGERWSPGARLRAGMLVDLIQRPGWATPMPTGTDAADPELPEAQFGSWIARDWLERAARALRHRRRTALILVLSTDEETTFLCLTSRSRKVWLATLPRTRLATLESLAVAARDEVEFALLGGGVGTTPEFVATCRAAFAELPTQVGDVIRAHRTLLVVSDGHAGASAVPLELLHDGDDHLGLTHIVARLPSLRDAAMLLESPPAPPPPKRAVVAAIAAAEGLAALPYAAGEADRLMELLRARGWQAPPFQERYIDPGFVVERLPYVGVLHIAAHGVVAADGEALLLPEGRRLTPADLEAAPRARAPFVYLSTCELGSTRYLGGGVRRGLAQAFVDVGAPAVVSSLTPVDDAVAAELSTVFYEEAGEHPVGEALRRARERLAAEGVGSALWATTVLLGDPELRLFRRKPGRRPRPRLPDRLLAAAGRVDIDREVFAELLQEARGELEADPDDSRLKAAVNLLLSRLAAADADPTAREHELRLGVELADELGHAGAGASARLLAAEQQLRLGRDRDARALLDSALPTLDSLNAVDRSWRDVRRKAYRRWEELVLLERGESAISVSGDTNAAEDSSLTGDELALISQAFAHRSGRAAFRLPEISADEILWNAVVLGHPLRFDSLAARARAGIEITAKLETVGAVPGAASTWAPVLLIGLLSYLWNGLVTLGVENVGLGARAVASALGDIRAWWSPPTASLLHPLLGFSDAVRASARDSLLATTDADARALELARRKLCDQWMEIAAGLRRSDPGALAGCTAFTLGTIAMARLELAEAGESGDSAEGHLRSLLDAMHEIVQQYAQLRGYASRRTGEGALTLWRLNDGVDDPLPPPLSRWL
jgi:hypothetical protein